MAEKVKIFEIAKELRIKSAELIEVCQKAGYVHIKHHSNALDPAEAKDVRNAFMRLYKPKVELPKKKPVAPPPKVVQRTVKIIRPADAVTAKPEAKRRAVPPRETAPAPEGPAPEPSKPKPVHGEAARRRASRIWAEARRAATVEEEGEPEAAPLPGAAEEQPGEVRKAPRVKKAPSRTRTVVFRQAKRPPVKKRATKIELTPPVAVRELSEKLGVSATEIIRRLMVDHQILANINQTIDEEAIQLIGLDYEVEIVFKPAPTAEDLLADLLPPDRPEDLSPRPPVVALLGHVDHGKTTILDRIRHTHVAGTEDGGITQDVGAWQITYKDRVLTFVDTPGHEAFTAMRARGAQVTDIVILVVAADDGVMPQTEEAISHARAAGVPIVVALNKVDKPDANTMRARQQLAGHGLNPEDWGGEVGYVELSALSGQGIDELIERTILEAEILELQGNASRPADGAVLEARVEEGRGVVANAIIRNGTLRPGDIVLCGPAYGRVRSLLNEHGKEVSEAGPSRPISICGLNRLPGPGDRCVVLEDADIARTIADERFAQKRDNRLQQRTHVTLENLYERLAAGREKQLRMILKADVEGSLEPLVESFKRIGTDEVSVKLLHRGVGDVNVSDVLLADASDAVVFAFRVGVDERAGAMVKECGVEVRFYRVIYEAVGAVRNALEGLLAPELREDKLGVAEVRQVFRISRIGNIAGCFVTDGTMSRSARARVMRGGEAIHEGPIGSLKREKEDVREVASGYECGIKLDRFDNVQIGDTIECFAVREVKRFLS